MELVSKTDIQQFAKRNTSPKVPIEGKIVEAYTDSLLNSSEFQEVQKNILNKIQFKDQFLIVNSYWPNATNINSEPYLSILAYAMLKKDKKLFELISQYIFTGTVDEYYGEGLFSSIVEYTDEQPNHYTDEGVYTDMVGGRIIIGFKNVYSTDVLEDGTGKQYQSESEYEKALNVFSDFITMVKPARINILLFHTPYCFLGGDETTLNKINIKDNQYFQSPFQNPTAINILRRMGLNLLLRTYNTVRIVRKNGREVNVEVNKKIKLEDDFVSFIYDIRTQEELTSEGNEIWEAFIEILAGNTSEEIYINEEEYREDREYFEGYIPLLLSLDDGSGAVLPFEIPADPSELPEVAALVYRRFYKGE